MLIKPPPNLRKLPLNTLAPNILTVCALCSGLTAIRFAIAGQWKFAVGAIVVAALFDMLDGRVARLLKGASKFGAELDSLADFLSFGVAPAVVLYFWSLQHLGNGNPGWLVVLAFSVCTALRLARFNTALDDPDKPVWTGSFFTGVPSPAGGGLALLLMILSFEFESEALRSPVLNAFWMLAAGALMVSRVPTFSFKRLRVPRHNVLPVLLGVGVLVASLANEPWFTISALGFAYLGSIPFAMRAHQRLKAGDAAAAAPPAEPAAMPAAEKDERGGDTRPPPMLH